MLVTVRGRRPLLGLAFAIFAAACAEAPAVVQGPAPGTLAPDLAEAVASITAEDIYDRVAFLASDELLGRATPSPGLDTAAAYIVREYRAMGVQPGGDDGTFLQRYPFRTIGLDTMTAHFGHILTDGSGNEMLTYGEDFFILPGGAGAGQDMNHAEIVWLGALRDGALPAGDYSGAAVVVTLPGLPGQAWQRTLLQAREQARLAGATALVAVTDEAIPGELFERLAEQSWSSESRTVRTPNPDQIAVFLLRPAAFGAIAAREGFDPAAAFAAPVRFERVSSHFSARIAVRDEAWPPNVIGIVPGSDPLLRDEYVVLSAHFDHVGVGEPVNGDSIYNGADDDASGTSALMEVAEALQMLSEAPRRSIMFLHVSGEEDGLLGSEWYSENPTVPLEQVVANINMDMIGRNSPDSIVVIGKDYSTLGDVANEVQRRHPELGLTLADDIWPEENFFFRSDHFHFARKGVPALFFFSGVHEDYHQPSDELERLDVDKVARISRMVLHLVLEIANADERPEWDPAGWEEVRQLVGG